MKCFRNLEYKKIKQKLGIHSESSEQGTGDGVWYVDGRVAA